MAPISSKTKTADEVDWLEYINEPLIDCRYVEDPTKQAFDVEDTHKAGVTATTACGKTSFILEKGSVVEKDPGFITALKKELTKQPKIFSDGQYTNTLFNEQAVAETYYANALVPVMHTLRRIFKGVLEVPEIAKAGYIFNIRQQHKAVNDGTRCDHYLTLDNLDSPHSAANALKLPKKVVRWVKAEDFAEALSERLNGEYPSMVLCIIEEKKTNVIVRESFIGDPKKLSKRKDVPEQIWKGAKNIDSFSPQLRLYSTEAACEFVVVTDYLNSVLLNINNTGLIRIKESGNIISDKSNGTAIAEEKRFPPRYQILAVAAKRLQTAGLIKVNPKGFVFTNPSSNK